MTTATRWGQYSPRLTRQQAVMTYCRDCGAMPGQFCTYIRRTAKPVGDRRIGMVTRRLHFCRTENPWWRMRVWLDQNYSIFEVSDEATDLHG